MWLTKQLQKIPYFRYNRGCGKAHEMSLVSQKITFNHQVSLMAQLSHVLWLNNSETNPHNSIGIIGKDVCVWAHRNINYFLSCTKKGFWSSLQKAQERGLPVGSVLKNLPANAGDRDSIPDLVSSHMPQSNYALVPQLLSLRSRAQKPQSLRPCTLEPVSTREAIETRSLCTAAREGPMQQGGPSTAKNKNKWKVF